MNKQRQGRRNRINGADLERKVVNLAKEAGIPARRIPGSGKQAKDHDDIEMETRLGTFTGECKYRKKIAMVYDICGEDKIGIVQQHRKQPLAVLPYSLFLEIVK